MNRNRRKHSSQIKIDHLVADAVSNAVVRRSQALETEESLTPLSDGEAGAIIGGVKHPPIVIAGIIALPEEVV